jgi:hypothetical protein
MVEFAEIEHLEILYTVLRDGQDELVVSDYAMRRRGEFASEGSNETAVSRIVQFDNAIRDADRFDVVVRKSSDRSGMRLDGQALGVLFSIVQA